MKTLIIYQSVHHGNTEKVAKAIAKELEVDIIKLDEIEIRKVKDYDLIGFGSGIYFAKHHIALLNLADKSPALKGKKAFIFSTSGIPLFTKFWHKELKQKLTKKGFNIIGEFSCKGFTTFSPYKLIGGTNKRHPDEKDLEKAKDFARKLLKPKTRR